MRFAEDIQAAQFTTHSVSRPRRQHPGPRLVTGSVLVAEGPLGLNGRR